MSDSQTSEKVSIDTRIREAEAYGSQGLYRESLGIFEKILSDGTKLDKPTRDSIQEKIQYLKTVIEDMDKDDDPKLTAHGVTVLQEAWTSEESPHEILDSASALKELGLYNEAISEYNKLFTMDYPNEKVVAELIECMFEVHSPSRVIDQIEKIITEQKIKEKEVAEIKFKLGIEMEKRGHKDLALEFYEKVKEINPSFTPKSSDYKKGAASHLVLEREKDSSVSFITAKINSILKSQTYSSRYDYLLKNNKITTTQLQNALGISKKSNKSVEHVLSENFKVPTEDIGKSLAYFYKCPFKTFNPQLPTPYELISKLKKAFLFQDLWVPLSWDIKVVDILIDDPKDLTKIDHIKALIKTEKISFSVGIKEDIEKYIDKFFGKRGEFGAQDKDTDEKGMPEFSLADIDFEEVEDEEHFEEETEASGQVVRLVDQLIIAAYRQNASDIHIEPSAVTKKTNIRYRIDGVCQDVMQIPNTLVRGVISRLKIMAGLDIAEKRMPQDGKIKMKRRGIPPFELRLATLPTVGQFEDAVLRILAEAGAMKVDSMGMLDRNLQVLKRIIQQPYGLILCVGPTGSGKTTTLHSALAHINKPGVKIWTAEDPVEITQVGLRQVEAKPQIGLDFARIMRAFLRADPDVIMIGEMRDLETAAIGIEASLTGHLVLSTLHTNSAPETVTRLLDMGLNPLNFSDAMLGILAQRLVRRLCKKCKEEFKPSKAQFDDIVFTYGEEAFKKRNINFSNDITLYATKGCEECSGSGYKGRLGIHEMLDGTKKIKEMIKKSANTMELFEQATADGMTTLQQDGILKVFEGSTDIVEVRRVCVT